MHCIHDVHGMHEMHGMHYVHDMHCIAWSLYCLQDCVIMEQRYDHRWDDVYCDYTTVQVKASTSYYQLLYY